MMYKFKKNSRKVIYSYMIICVLFIVCSVIIIFMNSNNNEHKSAVIYVNGNIYKVIELSDKIYTQYTIDTEYGTNIVEVNHGKIRVVEADCPDKTCVKSGYTSSEWKPIICIPHKLEIVIEGNELDGIVQ